MILSPHTTEVRASGTLSYRNRSRQPGFHHSTNSDSDRPDFAGRPRRRACFSLSLPPEGSTTRVVVLTFPIVRETVVQVLVGASPEVPLGGQFLPHPLENLFDNLLLAVHALNRLIAGEPLMDQFGLEVVDRRLGLLEQMLCMLSCGDLRPQSLPCRCARCVALIPVDDRDRDLAIPDEAPTLWT